MTLRDEQQEEREKESELLSLFSLGRLRTVQKYISVETAADAYAAIISMSIELLYTQKETGA